LWQSKFLRVCTAIILVLIILYLATKVSFLLNPVVIMFRTLLIPFVVSGFFYYLLRPLVEYLSKKVKTSIAILLIYFVVGGIATIFFAAVGPMLQTQMQTFITNVPSLVDGFVEQVNKLQENRLVAEYFTKNQVDLSAKLSEYLNHGAKAAGNYLSGLFTVMTNVVIVVTTVPIVLYYMLTDGHKASKHILSWIPHQYRHEGRQVLDEIDAALSGFIRGRIIICFLLGVMVYIGFLLIGLPYPLLLAVAAMVLNLIPYIGPIIGAVPALIVAFIESPSMIVRTLLVVIIAQQIDGNLLSPHIFGKSLDIHPLTIVVLLLVAGDVAGILGILLCIPVYLVAKIIVQHLNRLFRFSYE
jgi:predicted PurR-regulated permease PerM